MPELPEVEVIRSGLSELIAKKTIEKVNVLNAKSFQASTSSIDVFVNNSTILSVKRRAKILLIELSSGYSLVIHLKKNSLFHRLSIGCRWRVNVINVKKHTRTEILVCNK